jgi:hypothetical protein
MSYNTSSSNNSFIETTSSLASDKSSIKQEEEILDRNFAYLCINQFPRKSQILSDNASSINETDNGYYTGRILENTCTKPLVNDKIVDEWLINQSSYIVSLLSVEEFEAGVSNPSEFYVSKLLLENKNLTNQLLIRIYIDNLENSHVMIGILHMMSHFNYKDVYNAQSIALAALSQADDDVKDLAVRCYENWGDKDCIRVLETVHSDTKWLQSYIDGVIIDLKKANKME